MSLHTRGEVQPNHSEKHRMQGKDQREQIQQACQYGQRRYHPRDPYSKLETILAFIFHNLRMNHHVKAEELNEGFVVTETEESSKVGRVVL